MKRVVIFLMVLFALSAIASAQDLIVLRDGNVIEAKVMEITPTEIKYKRFNHLNGPTIVISRADVLSIRYENKTTEVINQGPNQAGVPASQQSGEMSALQLILNKMPAIPIAGNNLKFEFSGETWVSRVNGESFSKGTVEFEKTDDGGTLTLKQTHIWPGAAGKTAGKIASVVPGGSAASGALNTAGTVAGAAGAVEMSGPVIVLAYKAGTSPSLKLVSFSQNKNQKGNASAKGAANTSEKAANARNNWISAEIAFIGVGLRYERMLNSNISIGANFYYGSPLMDYVDSNYSYCEINAFFRVYPWGKTFFLGFGLGYHYGWVEYYFSYSYWNGSDYSYYGEHHTFSNHRFAVIPEIGWKIDLGKPGGFYIMPCITFPIDFGEYDMYYALGSTRILYLGMGIAF